MDFVLIPGLWLDGASWDGVVRWQKWKTSTLLYGLSANIRKQKAVDGSAVGRKRRKLSGRVERSEDAIDGYS